MLTKEENELLTRVGPETPCGKLMRRYWHPVAASSQLVENPVRKVRILCEDLVLFRDRSGRLGLVGDRCPHRRMHLQFGIPEAEGIRCPYHGWLFSAGGKCLEQPMEPPDSAFNEKIKITSYPVQEMGGLVWAYLGPQPAPLLPEWDLFVRPDGYRQILAHWLPCNWLQVMENHSDRDHQAYLHGRWFQYILERQGRLTDDPEARYNATMKQQEGRARRGVYRRHRPVYNEYGFTKGTIDSDQSEENPAWQEGAGGAVIFPYMSAPGDEGPGIRHFYQIGVPVDDTTTWHLQYTCFVFPQEASAPKQEVPTYVEVPLKDQQGEFILDYITGQDMVAFCGQGTTTDREQEHLGVVDSCIIAYRKMLQEQITIVQDGGEPMNVFRDPAKIHRMDRSFAAQKAAIAATFVDRRYRANYHKMSRGGWPYIDDDVERFSPDRETILELYRRTEAVQKAQRKAGE